MNAILTTTRPFVRTDLARWAAGATSVRRTLDWADGDQDGDADVDPLGCGVGVAPPAAGV